MKIEIVEEVTDTLVKAMQHLISQLTSNIEAVTKESLEEIINANDTILFVAKHNNKIIGTLTLVIFRIPTGKKAFIEDVVIDSEARGLGLGQRLIDVAINHAKKEDVKKIELSSNPNRVAANALYQKNGFKIRETNFYRLDIQ